MQTSFSSNVSRMRAENPPRRRNWVDATSTGLVIGSSFRTARIVANIDHAVADDKLVSNGTASVIHGWFQAFSHHVSSVLAAFTAGLTRSSSVWVKVDHS